MENKNNIINEFKERHACHEQVSLLFEQPFERQREALLDIEGKVRTFVGGDPEEGILHDGLDDGISWAHELPTPFEGLCVCHTTAAFVRDLHYPVFDLLHLNGFWSEVNVAYQHFSQQLS